MEIVEKDFILTPVSDDSNLYDLKFYKRVKKKDTGKFEMELDSPLYGLTLSNALSRIAHHRTAKKYEEDNVTLFEFLKELQTNYLTLIKLCRDSIPDYNFDSGG